MKQLNLENYLIDKEKGYLTTDISKGKITMLSGVWGSGKTHFWQEKIIKNKEIKTKNIYISLYGKLSIKNIENEIFIKAYYRSLDKPDEAKDMVEKIVSTFAITSKTLDTIFGTKIDEIKDEVLKINSNNKQEKAKNFIKDGLIICFDDFERKSSNIDLQDLFGFITNLALEFNARVVIILNSDVFSGKDKEIFTNVKEKSVSKYLSFAPTSEELFEMIFNDEKKDYKNELQDYKNILKSTITEVDIVNARIYIQVFDNVLEWIEKDDTKKDNDTLRCLILVNINFILNHVVFKFDNYPKKDLKEEFLPTIFFNLKDIPILGKRSLHSIIEQHSKTLTLELEVKDKIKDFMRLNNKNLSNEELVESIRQMDKYADLFWIYWNFDINLEFRRNISNEQLNKINNFIETGILF